MKHTYCHAINERGCDQTKGLFVTWCSGQVTGVAADTGAAGEATSTDHISKSPVTTGNDKSYALTNKRSARRKYLMVNNTLLAAASKTCRCGRSSYALLRLAEAWLPCRLRDGWVFLLSWYSHWQQYPNIFYSPDNVMIRAGFCNFFILKIYLVQCLSCFQEFYIATFSIFAFNFLLQFLSSIAQNVKA